MRATLAALSPARRAAIIVTAALLACSLLAAGAAAVVRMSGPPDRGPLTTGSAGSGATAGPTVPGIAARTLAPNQAVTANDEIARLRSTTDIAPATSRQHPLIIGESTEQPDLYARELVRRLLTQDYRTPRADLLGWVQAESAPTTEPLVLGLVPVELRGRWAVFSLTDPAQAVNPIPTEGDWAALGLRGGYTTVQVQRAAEPPSWSAAVQAGQITDPGVTAREVSALVTLHTLVNGSPRTSQTSVAITLNLEGPPTRDGWGLVTAVTYTAIPLGSTP